MSMFEKFRRSINSPRKDSKLKVKTITAYVLFGAIILVFALFGITPHQMGSDLGGTAAVVNGESISVSAFRRRVEMIERSTNLRLDQFPQAQREMFSRELRRRALDEMISSEALFQSSKKIGIRVPDSEVRKMITTIPYFVEKERFQRERYENFLMASGQSSAQFERDLRKDLVSRRMQDLFAQSNKFSQATLDGIKALDQVEISFKFVALDRTQLIKAVPVSDAEISAFLKDKAADVEADYNRRKVEFQTSEEVQARHILIRSDEKQSKDQAKKKAMDLKKDLTVQNFAAQAQKFSDDPGSKSKGGELGSFSRGRMVPEFENAAFSLEPGVISEPVETEYGYHIILVEKKDPGGQKQLKDVEKQIAKDLIAKGKVDHALAEIKTKLAAKDGTGAKMVVNSLNLKWQSVENVSLGTDFISGLAHPEDALKVIASQKGQTGFIPQLNEWGGQAYLIDLTKWSSKTAAPPKPADREGTPEERIAGEAFQKWMVSLNESLKVERNARLLQ